MRRGAIVFVGLVAAIASCSSYGDGGSEQSAKGDGGSSGNAIVDGGSSGSLSSDGGSPANDSGTKAVPPLAPTPAVVQVTSAAMSAVVANEVELTFHQGLTAGNLVLLFVATWGAKFKDAYLDVGDTIAMFNAVANVGSSAAFVAPVGTNDSMAKAVVKLETGATTTPAAEIFAIEVTNGLVKQSSTSSGVGLVGVDLGDVPGVVLWIVNVAGTGHITDGPAFGESLGKITDNSSHVMVAGRAKGTSAKIAWSADNDFQWDAIAVPVFAPD